MSIKTGSNYLTITVLLLILFGIGSLAYSQCNKTATTIVPAVVYDKAPAFSSRGWQMGNVITNLPAHTRVRICEEVIVGLFFEKKKWCRIEFGSGHSGWIFSGQLNMSAVPTRGSNYARSFVIPEVQAQEPGVNSSDQGIPGFKIWTMLVVAFIFVVLGMIGKVAYDELDKGQRPSFRSTFKLWKCLKSLIVAPIVFGAFLTLGKFSFENEIAIIIFFCLAFQNGFFWQTVLPTKVASKPA